MVQEASLISIRKYLEVIWVFSMQKKILSLHFKKYRKAIWKTGFFHPSHT